MTLIKKLAIVGVAALALGATACGSSGTDTAASSTTAAPASTTTEKESSTTTEKKSTTTEKESSTTTEKKSSTTKVTRPPKVEKIEASELPAGTGDIGADLGFTEEETDCVNTVIYIYAQDPANPTDDASISGLVGGAVAACVDQGTIASVLVDSIKEAAPELTATQADCIETQIATADTDSLAVFLGAFMYEGPDADTVQAPFIEALDAACGLSS